MRYMKFSITDSGIICYKFECCLAQLLKFILHKQHSVDRKVGRLTLLTAYLGGWQWALAHGNGARG